MDIPLLIDLLLIFGLAIPLLLVCHWLRIASVVGFLITGVIVGPHALGIITDAKDIEILAEIGIVFLLFTIGIEFSLDNLLRIKKFVFVGGTLQVVFTIAAVFLISTQAGLGRGPSVFIGFLLSLSSTAIVLKLLQERAEVESPHGQAALAILIFQDMVVVPMMILTPFLAGAPGQNQGSLILLLAKGVGLVVVVILSAKWLVPRVLYQITRTRSRELFLLGTLAMCFAVAFLSYSLGLSLALGAFMAGLIVSKTDFSFETLGNIIPFRDLFASLFFISIGMLVDLEFFIQNPLRIVVIAFLVVVLKSVLAGTGIFVLRYPLRTSILTGLALCQVGEFSFVLFDKGQELGLLSADHLQLFLDVSVVTMALTPFIIALGPRIAGIFSRLMPARFRTGWAADSGPGAAAQAQILQDHLIIVGFGLNGRNLGRAARMAGIPYVILEMNSQTVKKEREKGEPIYYGDAAQEEVLKHVNAAGARIIVLVISDPDACRRITAIARKENPRIFILVRTRFLAEMGRLYALGANEVIPEEFETSIEIFSRVLSKYLIPRHEIEILIAETRADGYQMFRSLSKESTSFGDLKHYLPDVEVSTVRISEGSPVAGQSIGQVELRKNYGVTVLAIRRDHELISNPDAGTVLKQDDLVILVGAPARLTSACTLFSPQNPCPL
jgi:CPA2 family monovalent cation:H+ antiporter-2